MVFTPLTTAAIAVSFALALMFYILKKKEEAKIEHD